MADLKINLLSDEPTDRDEFKSHDNVAQTIVALISSDADGGKAIGVTGSWGSGKSTVIELLKGKLLKLKGCQTLVFQFDAWTHQDDPPRRAFLEALHEFLLNSPYTREEAERQSDSWGLAINKIVGKSETSTTTTQKEIAPVGAAIAILLLITVPLAGYVAKEIGLGYGLLFVLLPVLVAVVAAAVNHWLTPPEVVSVTTMTPEQQPKKPTFSNQLLRVLLRDTVETKTAETEKADDATSTDFRRVFGKILDDVLLVGWKRRLLVVVDNLDRVDAQKAVSIWSTMRIFFELDAQSCKWKSKFWLIAPFDPAALRRLWAAEDADDKESAALVESFINKTFQVTFRVSPPVVARWRDFFERNFREVFQEEERQREWRTIYRLYDRFTTQPSFRDIKLFLNKLAVLYLQWEDEIPLPFLALYLLIAPKTKDSVLEIVTGRRAGDGTVDPQPPELVNAAVLGVLPPVRDATGKVEPDGWKKQIAAVHFNVLPKEVVHALIGNDLQQAISAGDAATIRRLAQVPDFWTACEQVVEDRLPDLEGTPALLSTLRLLHDAVPSQAGEPAAQRVMMALSERAAKLEDWDFSAVPLVNEIIPRDAHREYRLFRRNVLRAAQLVPFDVNEAWLRSVETALNSLDVRRFRFQTGEAGSFLKVTRFLMRDNAPQNWQVTIIAREDVLPALADYVSELQVGEVQPLVERLLPLATGDRWEEVRAKWVARITNGHVGLPLLIEGVLAVPTADLRRKHQVLKSLAIPSVALALTSAVGLRDWRSAASCCVALFADAEGAGEFYGRILRQMAASEAAELYQAFLSEIQLVNAESMLLVPGLEQAATGSVARRAVVDLSGPPGDGALRSARFQAAEFVSRYRRLARVLEPAELAEVVEALVRSSDLLDVLCRPSRFRVGRSGLYQILLRTDGRARLLAFLLESINRAHPSHVIRALHINPEFQGLFVELVDAAGPAWLSVELANVLAELDKPTSVPAETASMPFKLPPGAADTDSNAGPSEGAPT